MAIPSLRDLDPLPAEVLAPAELQALHDWRGRWGHVVQTREPSEGRTLLRPMPDRLPLIELVNRRAYNRLLFARWLADCDRAKAAMRAALQATWRNP